MIYKSKKKVFSAAYLRFRKQLSALHAGKLWIVKNLALEARQDQERKTNLQQVSLSISL